MKLYVVTMYRWGNRDNHSYFLGAFDNKATAKEEWEKEEINRGGKYYAEVIETEINDLNHKILIDIEKRDIEYLRIAGKRK